MTKKDKKTFAIVISLSILFLGSIIYFMANEPDTPKIENYNDDSPRHRDHAMYALEDAIKDCMKDADSYERISYESYYLPTRHAYSVTIKFKGTNSFGAYITERITAVVFIDSQGKTTIKQMHKLSF